MGIHGGLLEAYIGTHEDDWGHKEEYRNWVASEGRNGEVAVEAYEGWLHTKMIERIRAESAEEHLRVYCEWNGILGYSRTLFDIATGKIEV